MLKTIILDGFKDQSRSLRLGRLNLFVGGNGLGKSAFIEGLVYALSGRVPGGKSKDEVAKCFAPRGGLVRVTDDEGRWIERGIDVDHRSARVSEVLETEPEEAPTAISIWDCNEALLDFRHFVDLSSAKRRDFMLDLVGAAGGKLTLEKGREILLAGFAKELGGDGADESCILDPLKLPEKLRPVAFEWKWIWEYIASFGWPGTDASAALSDIVSTAKTKKNEARTASKAAKSSLSELKVELRGAKIAAGEYEEAKAAKEWADRRHAEAKSKTERIDSIQERVERSRTLAQQLEQKRGELQEKIGATEPVPDPGGFVQSVDAEESVIRSKLSEGARLRLEHNDHAERVAVRDNTFEQVRKDERSIAEHKQQPIGRLVAAMATLRRELNPSSGFGIEIVELLQVAVDAVAASWKHAVDGQTARLEAEQTKLDGMNRVIVQDVAVPTSEDIARNRSEVDILKSNVARIRVENDKSTKLRADAQTERAARTGSEEELARLDGRIRSTIETLTSETAALTAAGDLPDVAMTTENRDAAATELERLERLRGSLDTYEGAKDRAFAATAKDAAWTAFERAVVDARETYVAELAEPIKDDVGVLLAAAGRDERPYLELENARGRPVFDLGWVVGDSRRSLNALSHGEAAVFGAAVAVAIARRARGRKLLLVEADRIDVETLEALLAGLVAIEDEFDAVMVSTHTQMVMIPFGWRVHEFDSGGGITSRDITKQDEELQRAREPVQLLGTSPAAMTKSEIENLEMREAQEGETARGSV